MSGHGGGLKVWGPVFRLDDFLCRRVSSTAFAKSVAERIKGSSNCSGVEDGFLGMRVLVVLVVAGSSRQSLAALILGLWSARFRICELCRHMSQCAFRAASENVTGILLLSGPGFRLQVSGFLAHGG